MPLPAQVPTLTTRYIPTLNAQLVARCANYGEALAKAERTLINRNAQLAVVLHKTHTQQFGSRSLTRSQLAEMIKQFIRFTKHKENSSLRLFIREAYCLYP
mgnify:FL=1